MTLTDLLNTLEFAFLSGGFATRSDFARENAEIIAFAGQTGFLTTDTPRDGFCNVWRPTPMAFVLLFDGPQSLIEQFAPSYVIDTDDYAFAPTTH